MNIENKRDSSASAYVLEYAARERDRQKREKQARKIFKSSGSIDMEPNDPKDRSKREKNEKKYDPTWLYAHWHSVTLCRDLRKTVHKAKLEAIRGPTRTLQFKRAQSLRTNVLYYVTVEPYVAAKADSVASVIIPLYYNIVHQFYADAGAEKGKDEEHITLQLSLELAKDFRRRPEYEKNGNRALWTALSGALKDPGAPQEVWQDNIRDIQEAKYTLHIAPSNKYFEWQAGFDVVWFFSDPNDHHWTYFLQAKLQSEKKPANFSYNGTYFLSREAWHCRLTNDLGFEQLMALERTDEWQKAGQTNKQHGFVGYLIYGGENELWLIPADQIIRTVRRFHEIKRLSPYANTRLQDRALKTLFCIKEYLFGNMVFTDTDEQLDDPTDEDLDRALEEADLTTATATMVSESEGSPPNKKVKCKNLDEVKAALGKQIAEKRTQREKEPSVQIPASHDVGLGDEVEMQITTGRKKGEKGPGEQRKGRESMKGKTKSASKLEVESSEEPVTPKKRSLSRIQIEKSPEHPVVKKKGEDGPREQRRGRERTKGKDPLAGSKTKIRSASRIEVESSEEPVTPKKRSSSKIKVEKSPENNRVEQSAKGLKRK
ncbi:hypothetical protein B0H16DRAFT_1683207 [Mycena metata]|uniref:Uncharacterized protein n=1 Tax=Mycena metata TaxID=1033252 RepID=A0AAD7K7L2_9AGAR|nr:hypothetical protein B0H16DRAFT_1683207 [Mycena metata]